MPRRRMPSLSALRCFEALGRHLSFTRAGTELGITQAAVSRQIKALEEDLAVRLVTRGAGGNSLTAAGEILFGGVHRAFGTIEDTVQRITGSGEREILNVSLAPYFSACWLTPRLMAFVQRHQNIDLRLHHSYQPADHRREGIEIGINWGAGAWPGVVKEKILDGGLTPVAAPGLLSHLDLGGDPARLLAATLLYEFDIGDWRLWFAEMGHAMPTEARALRLSDSHALRRAAIDGHGVALFCHGLVQADLAAGLLVQPFGHVVHTGYDYYLNYAEDAELTAKAKAFRHWILDEVARAPLA